MAIFEPIFQELNGAGIRYVVVGGLAVVLHGHARLTADIDLMIDLAPAPASEAMTTIISMGFLPRLPVEAMDFADPQIRSRWIQERGMQVFSLYDPSNPLRSLDLFVSHPIPFEKLWGRSEQIELTSTRVRVASIPDLIALKRLAGRPVDADDIAHLEAIQEHRKQDRNG